MVSAASSSAGEHVWRLFSALDGVARNPDGEHQRTPMA